MRKLPLLLCLLLPIILFSQNRFDSLQKRSDEVWIYKITANVAAGYAEKEEIKIEQLEQQQSFRKYPFYSKYYDSLPTGNYIAINIIDREVNASFFTISNLFLYVLNNQKTPRLVLQNKEGKIITGASLWVNNKLVAFDEKNLSYNVGKNYKDDVPVKVYTSQDTAFFILAPQDDLRYTIKEQRRQNFKASRFYSIVSWLPKKIGNLFKPSYARTKRYKTINAGAGMVIFNQPKYKLTDTVKFKAYIYDQKKKFYTKETDVFLEYYSKGKRQQQLLKTLAPASPGSYHYEFPLSDTLPNDTRYTLTFYHNKQRLLSNTFTTEDYLLDQVAKENFRSEKTKYYAGDSLRFFASATDANGLGVLDMKTRLIVTSVHILKFFKDTLYVADTLYDNEKKLLPEGETVYTVPTSQFPLANLDMQAELILTNGNNELHSKTVRFDYASFDTTFTVNTNKDSVYATLLVNGRSIAATGYYTSSGGYATKKEIHYPAVVRIDPAAQSYNFYIRANEKNIDSAHTYLNNYYGPVFSMISSADTLGFILSNPYKIPILYTVFDGNKSIANGGDSVETISWKRTGLSIQKAYIVKWQYLWNGKENYGEQTIGILHNKLDVSVRSKEVIFPGENDSITVHITDYKKRNAGNINVTAVSYNAQFSNSIRFPNLPNLAVYKKRKQLLHDKYETEDENGFHFKRSFPLGKQLTWKTKLGVDSLQYYQYLFPANGFKDVVTPLQNFEPQVAVHLVRKGEPQSIYMLYVNRELVYYKNVTERMRYAYNTPAGFTQIAFRLYDSYVEIDSIYLQPHYKHDIIIDLDHLPAKARVKEMPASFDATETRLLSASIWRLDNNAVTNTGYAWQNSRLVSLSGSRRHIVGPFLSTDSVQFFAPGSFDIKFMLERDYVYTLSNKILRLEKIPLFNTDDDYKLSKPVVTNWVFGDTLIDHPVIEYPVPVIKPQLYLTHSPVSKYFVYGPDKGNLYFTIARDTVISYTILIAKDRSDTIIAPGNYGLIRVLPGSYKLLFVDKHFKAIEMDNVQILANNTLCIHAEKIPFEENSTITAMATIPPKTVIPDKKETKPLALTAPITYTKGTGMINGMVTDAKGKQPIIGASVLIKGTSTGVITDAKGNFSIANIREGNCTIVVSMIGYQSKEISLMARSYYAEKTIVELSLSEYHLDEVVVVGYGMMRKASVVSAVSLNQALTGKVAGVSIGSERRDSTLITIRGVSSLSGDIKPLYVIDGIIYDEMPSSITTDMITSIDVLKGADAAIYGSRGANGVIVVKTKRKQQRTIFKDYAIWQPELLTDKDGKVKFVATYPDNITGWQTYIVGLDKKGRVGLSVTQVQSYKPISAQLNMPTFLIEGDTAHIIGKMLNYTSDTYRLSTTWKINNQIVQQKDPQLDPKSSLIYGYNVVAPNAPDSLKATFSLATETGFNDGEEKSIPVYQKGTEEADGNFYLLQRDTIIQFASKGKSNTVELYAQNNTLDVLLNEIEYIRKYPYFCMEQTASKLRGLQMLKTIKTSLNEKFEDENEMHGLIKKLLKAQLYEGGWGWWEGGNTNLYISNYVLSVLLPFRSDPQVELAVRNTLLYLQNNLKKLNRQELLPVLLAMAKANHQMDYTPYIQKIPFDSISQHNQWQYVQLKQLINAPYKEELNLLIAKSISGVLGDLHWGTETYRWYNNGNATTQIAFEVLYKEKQFDKLNGITQYFLAQRKNGYWRNTFESASICSAMLPYILSQQQNFKEPAKLQVNGDTSFTISTFPQKINMRPGIQQLTVTKSGGGLTYLTMYEKFWNKKPQAVTDLFDIQTKFESNGREVKTLTAGEKVKMKVTVNALKEAEYVMVEIPIPAGCIYGAKNQPEWYNHREYFKNKVVLFAEQMSKGIHTYEIDLEIRYGGNYTLNPAKVSLMYFPTFYGRNPMDKVEIK